MSNGAIESYPQFKTGNVALAPANRPYVYVPTVPGGLEPPVIPPPTTIEGYPPMSTMGVAIAPDGGVWQLQPTQPGGITEVAPALPPPSNTVLPVLTYVTGGGGPANVGSVYQLSTGTWTPATPAPTYARQWMRNELPIPGATATAYTVQLADVGALISGMVTATNATGTGGPVGSNAAGPINEPAEDPEPTTLPHRPVVRHGGGKVPPKAGKRR